jgi:hypothetical protein
MPRMHHLTQATTMAAAAILGTAGLSVGLGLDPAAAALAGTVTPSLVVTPSAGPAGSIATVTWGPSGEGCGTPTFEAAPGNSSATKAALPYIIDGGTQRFIVPSTAPGSYELRLSCNATNNPASEETVTVPFTVTAPPSTAAVAIASSADGKGYWLALADGNVLAYGDAASYGSLVSDGITPATQIVAITATPDGKGYWLTGADGGVFAFGVARYAGSNTAAQPATGLVTTPDGNGYWIGDSGGGASSYGDSVAFPDAIGPLNQPAVGIAATATGSGFWEVASDGGIFSFGNAAFLGSMGGQRLNQPVVGMAADRATGGYWEVASDGGIFSFHTPFFGSTGDITLNAPIVGMAATPGGDGYWLLGADGGVFTFGDAGYYGSAA